MAWTAPPIGNSAWTPSISLPWWDPIPASRFKFLKKKNHKKPRPLHNIRGIAKDNVAVAKVEARFPGKKGWRKAKLRKSGRFRYRTPRLKKKVTRIRFRAIDTSNNRSKVKRARVRGLDPARKFFPDLPGGGPRG